MFEQLQTHHSYSCVSRCLQHRLTSASHAKPSAIIAQIPYLTCRLTWRFQRKTKGSTDRVISVLPAIAASVSTTSDGTTNLATTPTSLSDSQSIDRRIRPAFSANAFIPVVLNRSTLREYSYRVGNACNRIEDDEGPEEDSPWLTRQANRGISSGLEKQAKHSGLCEHTTASSETG